MGGCVQRTGAFQMRSLCLWVSGVAMPSLHFPSHSAISYRGSLQLHFSTSCCTFSSTHVSLHKRIDHVAGKPPLGSLLLSKRVRILVEDDRDEVVQVVRGVDAHL